MRCYFMAEGHIRAVELLTVSSDEEAITQSIALFRERAGSGFDRFEVWDRTRCVYQHPSPRDPI